MLMNEYVAEKLRELDEERLTLAMLRHRGAVAHGEDSRRTKPVIGPVMRMAGRTLRRASRRARRGGRSGSCQRSAIGRRILGGIRKGAII